MFKVLSDLFNDKEKYEKLIKPNVKHTVDTLQPNTKVINLGERQSNFYLIRSGMVNVVLSEQFHTVVAMLSEGDTFGEFRLFDDYPASADVVTVAESTIVAIDINSFKNFLETEPLLGQQVYLEMLRVLVNRLVKSNQQVVHLMKSAVDFQKQLHEMMKIK